MTESAEPEQQLVDDVCTQLEAIARQLPTGARLQYRIARDNERLVVESRTVPLEQSASAPTDGWANWK